MQDANIVPTLSVLIEIDFINEQTQPTMSNKLKSNHYMVHCQDNASVSLKNMFWVSYLFQVFLLSY